MSYIDLCVELVDMFNTLRWNNSPLCVYTCSCVEEMALPMQLQVT